VGFVLALVIIELTAVTAYLHLSLGGQLFTLNGLGYLGLAAAYGFTVFVPVPFIQRFGWLPRLSLAAYTIVTIGAYLVMGPYYFVGWTAKGIEVAIVALLLADVVGAYGDLRGLSDAVLRSLPATRSRERPRQA
jgi:hypothetical protein